MKRIIIWAALALSFMLGLRLVPGFAQVWGGWVSRPILRGLSWFGDRAPFSILEWGVLTLAAFLLLSLPLRRFFRNLLCILLALASVFLTVWYPLYFAAHGAYGADMNQIAASSERLIDELNASELDFSQLPALPAKFARFPRWMELLQITGFGSFFTGEALISPDLPACSLPFIAVHERMHIQGFADEGAANIAAWQECMARGGVFADSARLWALRYSMGLLRSAHPESYDACLDRMNPCTLRFYREAGGAYAPLPRSGGLQAAFSALHISSQLSSYEILAVYLAADMG